jgi:hypothetical protein
LALSEIPSRQPAAPCCGARADAVRAENASFRGILNAGGGLEPSWSFDDEDALVYAARFAKWARTGSPIEILRPADQTPDVPAMQVDDLLGDNEVEPSAAVT